MKKYAFTIAAVAVFAALLAFVLLNKKDKEEPPAPDQFFTVLEFVREDLHRFEIVEYAAAQALNDQSGAVIPVASRVALERAKDGSWTVAEPGPPRADKAAVDTFLYNFAALQVERKVEDNPGDLDKYGLAHPHYQVKAVMKDKKQHIVHIGALNELANGYYLKVVGKKPVYIIPRNYLDTVFDAQRLIDKSLVSLDPQESFVSATLQAGDIRAECRKEKDQWTLSQGAAAQDCNYIGTGLFDALLDARFTDWFPPDSLPETKQELGLAPGRIHAHAVTDRDTVIELSIGKQVMDKVFVENVTRGEIYLAPAAVEQDIRDLLVEQGAE